MSFKSRLTLGFLLVSLAPLVAVGILVRREMRHRLSKQADARIAALVERARHDLDLEVRATRARLATLTADLAGDNRFRLAVTSTGDRGWLLDWAGQAMRAGGFGALVLLDSAGTVLSSGQFRNEFDRSLTGLPATVARAGGAVALVVAPTAEGTVAALVGVDSLEIGGRRFWILGGRGFDANRVSGFASDADVTVALVTDETKRPPNVVAELTLPFLDLAGNRPLTTAWLMVSRDPGPTATLLRSVDRYFLLAIGLTLLLATAAALALARAVSKPLAELSRKTESLDLDRLDQDFATDRGDEIGGLSRLLQAMSLRLRSSTAKLRDAERRAAVGDLSRQLNHDVKNGLAPIKNVVRHLVQTAEQEPATLPTVFGERRKTLESSVEYLESLARNYARLSPVLDRSRTDVNELLGEVARSMGEGRVVLRLGERVPPVQADRVALRRILENLATNAADAVGGKVGAITFESGEAEGAERPMVRLTVADAGPGMTQAELDRAFEDFYTTKPNGTGLGLSVVRRLVGDLGGSLKVETAPGAGSRFTVELPAA